MDAVLMKYKSRNGEYLVMDTGRNDLKLDAHAVRTICSRNFGVGSMGILVGDTSDSSLRMEWYNPQGVRTELDEDARSVVLTCARDALNKRSDWSAAGRSRGTGARPYLTGKVFLTEKFISGNHLCMA